MRAHRLPSGEIHGRAADAHFGVWLAVVGFTRGAAVFATAHVILAAVAHSQVDVRAHLDRGDGCVWWE